MTNNEAWIEEGLREQVNMRDDGREYEVVGNTIIDRGPVTKDCKHCGQRSEQHWMYCPFCGIKHDGCSELKKEKPICRVALCENEPDIDEVICTPCFKSLEADTDSAYGGGQ